jgi:hypothetical protein
MKYVPITTVRAKILFSFFPHCLGYDNVKNKNIQADIGSIIGHLSIKEKYDVRRQICTIG